MCQFTLPSGPRLTSGHVNRIYRLQHALHSSVDIVPLCSQRCFPPALHRPRWAQSRPGRAALKRGQSESETQCSPVSATLTDEVWRSPSDEVFEFNIWVFDAETLRGLSGVQHLKKGLRPNSDEETWINLGALLRTFSGVPSALRAVWVNECVKHRDLE